MGDDSTTEESLEFKHSIAAIGYAESVISGDEPACKWVRLAAQRFMDDLAWAEDDDFPFYFDADAARRACTFIENLPHIKGQWALRHDLLHLEPWQLFFVCNAFGWMRKKDGKRRFRQVVLIVPRKNAKSTLAAAMGLYMLASDGEFGAEIYSGATNEKQAWEVFKPAQLMARKTPDMVAAFGLEVNASNINIIQTASKFETIIGDPGDGSSPSMAIVDEYHEHKSSNLYDTMQTGMGAREQPMMLVITTAGTDISGPCYELQERVQSMLAGTRADNELFGLIYTIDEDDDWTTEAAIRKANPNLDISVSLDFLLARQREGLASPKAAAVFKTKHLDVWVQSRSAYFNLQDWLGLAQPDIKIEDFAHLECMIGIDLAEKKDLTAIEVVFRRPKDDNGKHEFARFGYLFCPEDTINEAKNDHFQAWRDVGEMIETEGAIVDQRVVQGKIEELCRKFNVREVVFDPWHSRQMGLELAEAGLAVCEFRGTPSNMNEPMRELDALITDKRIIHDGSISYAWMLGNVVNTAVRGGELHRPGKEKPRNKIDGPIGTIMCIGRWLLDEGPRTITIPAGYEVG